MKKKIYLIYFFVIVIFLISPSNISAHSPDFIVAKDSSGNFTSIQQAINAVPSNPARRYIIYIKNGTYNEKIYIDKKLITLIGENKDSTRIVYAELRSIWRQIHTDDYGAAVINLGDNVTDLVLSTLTVYNNYGSIYGSTNHQFAIRGGKGINRIIIYNCNIIADGGDTLSLWNTPDGMYFHKDCYFEGYVDFVCPRGYCYIEDSKFFGHNLSASIWHDGTGSKDNKFVIKNSRFDGVKDFSLGRFHRDAQFFLVDCSFSKNMKDQKIYCVPGNKLQWSEDRQYYFNCHRDSTDFNWYADNLSSADSNLKPEMITAKWTFNNTWDPDSVLTSIEIIGIK